MLKRKQKKTGTQNLINNAAFAECILVAIPNVILVYIRRIK